MPWTTPETFTAGQTLTAASMNVISENTRVLYARDGLTFIKSQTIGSAVSSVTVTNAFSETYDNYLVTVTNVDFSGSNDGFVLRLGSSTTRTDYYMVGHNINNSNGAVGVDRYTGSALGMLIGYTTANETNFAFTIMAPFLAQPSSMASVWHSDQYGGWSASYDQSPVSYSDFTVKQNGATTATGGEIRVYGYLNS